MRIKIFVISILFLASGYVNTKQSNKLDEELKTKRTYASSTFEENNGKIYSAYNRSLRDNPTLEGKILFEIKIDPEGNVVDLYIISSELKNQRFERKLTVLINSFKFKPRDSSDVLVVTYPLDFIAR